MDEQAATAVGLLALVAGQDVEPADDSDGRDGRWRIAQRTVPDRVISTVDPKAGRILTIRPQHDELAAARRQAATDPVGQDDYRRWRHPVERAIASIVARGNRRLRHIGTIENNAWLHTSVAALNLRTLINLGPTRTGNAWTLEPKLTKQTTADHKHRPSSRQDLQWPSSA